MTITLKRVLLFSHDPGGSNTIIPLVPALQKAGYEVLLYGKNFALERYGQWGLQGVDICDEVPVQDIEALTRFLKEKKPERLVTGTSAVDPTEKYLWRAAADVGIPSLAILDQWINYGIRFSPFSTLKIKEYETNPSFPYLPDAIGIMDHFAKTEMVAEGLPEDRLHVTGQPYFQALRQDVADMDSASARQKLGIKPTERVLVFVSEPITISHGEISPLGYSEKTIFNLFLKTLKTLDTQLTSPLCVLLKLHPKESVEQLPETLKSLTFQNIRILVDQATHPWKVISAADWLVGMSSILLIEAALCEKPVVSVQIGLQQDNPLVLCRQGILKPVLDEETLQGMLQSLLLSDIVESVRFNVVSDPVQRVLNVLENLTSRHHKTCAG